MTNKLMGFRKRSLLHELGFLGLSHTPPFSLFKERMANKGKDKRPLQVNGVPSHRILERDELRAIYAWLFDIDQQPVIPFQASHNPQSTQYEDYEIELLKVQYSDYVQKYISEYLNRIVKSASLLYQGAEKYALTEERPLYTKERSKNGFVRQKTRKVLNTKGAHYSVPIKRISVSLPSMEVKDTVRTALQEVVSMVLVLSQKDHWEALELVYSKILPLFSSEESKPFQSMRYMEVLHRELRRVKIKRFTREGRRVMSLEGLEDFQAWLSRQP